MTPPPREPARKADVSVVTPYAKTMLAASKRAECAAKGGKEKDSQFKFHWISLKHTIHIGFMVYFGNPEKHVYTDWYLDVGIRESSPEESGRKNDKQDTKTTKGTKTKKDTKPSKTKKTAKTKKPKTAKSSVPASKPSSKKSPTDYGEAKRRFVAEPLSKH